VKKIETISVCGLGKLGACVATHFAAHYPVLGIDIDNQKVEAINSGLPPVEEPGLAEAITAVRGRLQATSSFDRLVDTDATFFITPTPSVEDGSFTPEYMLSAMQSVARAVKASGKIGHLFVCCSTTTPGDCEKVLIPMLEAELGGKVGEAFGFVYNPEFIAIGSVLRDLASPDLILIGESDTASGEAVEAVYKTVLRGTPTFARLSMIEAELTKISINAYVTMKISFTNQLRMVAEQLGADPARVLEVVGSDSRVGKKYLRPGLSYGGPCFPRDNRLFHFISSNTPYPALLAQATDAVNDQARTWLLDKVRAVVPKGGTVVVLGLAYKPDTHITLEAAGFHLAQALKAEGYLVLVHDFCATPDRSPEVAEFTNITNLSDLATISNLSSVVIALPDVRYKDVVKALSMPVTVLDFWT
jgi:UDPglucose 6-dehydrogenase